MTEMQSSHIPETPLGRELRQRAGGSADNDIIPISANELRSMADAFDHQEYLKNGYSGALENQLAPIIDKIDRMALTIRLMRFYALNPVILPEQDQVIAFLRAYIDDGRWLAMPWPSDLPIVAKFIADAGYFNLNGVVSRPASMQETSR